MAAKKPPAPRPDFLNRLSVRRQHALALIFLFILPVVLFHSTILGDQKFMASDTIQWRAGAESVIEYREQNNDEEPLWVENMFGGMPAYTVSVKPSVPHLDSLVFDRLRMIWPAVPYWVLLGGAYLLLFLMGFRPFTAALGAVLIAFTTYMPVIIGAGHNAKFIAFSFIPWMVSGYWLLTRTDRRLAGFFLFAVALTLEFRAGHPQVTYYFVFLFVALYLFDTWDHYKNQLLKNWWKITAMVTGAVLLGLLGGAEHYFRLLEYSPHSIRGGSALAGVTSGSGLSMEYAFRWSQGILETLTLVIPNLFGGDSSMAYWGEKPGTAGPHYFGAVATVLFVVALFRVRKPIVWLFLGVGLLTLTFSWGHNFRLNDLWFHILPAFDKFRTPEMWLIVTVFCFTIVALYGLQDLVSLTRTGAEKVKKLWLPLGLPLGFGLLLLIAGGTLLPLESDQEFIYISEQVAAQNNLPSDNLQVLQQTRQIINTQVKPARQELLWADTFRYLIVAGAAAALIVFFVTMKIGSGVLLLGLLLLVSWDMLSADKRYISENALVSASIEPEDVIEQQASPADRFIQQNIMSEEGYPFRALPLEGDPFNNAIYSYFYPSIGGYSGAKLSIVQDVIEQGLFAGPTGINSAVLDMLNVKYFSISTPIQLDGYEQVFSEESSYVYESLNVQPKAWFVDSLVTVPTPMEAFRHILPDAGFQPGSVAIVETGASLPEPLVNAMDTGSVSLATPPVNSVDAGSDSLATPPANSMDSGSDSLAMVEVDRYEAGNLQFSLSRSEPGFLVISEIYYPEGWTATLDGEQIPIYKTNYLLRGVVVPPGEHTLEMTFTPSSHKIGTAASWTSNIIQWLIGIGLLAGWVKNRKRAGADD